MNNSLISSILVGSQSKVTNTIFQNYICNTLTTSSEDIYKNDSFISSQYFHNQNAMLYMYNCTFTGQSSNSMLYASTGDSHFVLTECLFDRVKLDGTKVGSCISSYSRNCSLIRTRFTNQFRNSGCPLCSFTYVISTYDFLPELIIDGCVFSNITTNGSNGAGFLVNRPISLTFKNCTFEKITSANKGGAMQLFPTTSDVETTLTISHCIFSDITAASSGGSLDIGAWTTFYLEYCTFTSILTTTSSFQGGIICIQNKTTNIYIHHNEFDPRHLQISQGGAIYAKHPTSSLSLASVINNTFINTCGGSEEQSSLYIGANEVVFESNKFMNNQYYNTSSFIVFEQIGKTTISIKCCEFENHNSKSFMIFSNLQTSNIVFNIEDCLFSNCIYGSEFLSLTDNFHSLNINNISFRNTVFSTYFMNIDVSTSPSIHIDNLNIQESGFTGTSTIQSFITLSTSISTFQLVNSYFNLENLSSNSQRLIHIKTTCNPEIINCEFCECLGISSYGIILYLVSTITQTCTIRSCYISNCHNSPTSSKNGLFYFANSYLNLQVSDCHFINCSATSASTIYCSGASSNNLFSDCTFHNLQSTSHGGSHYLSGSSSTFTFNNCSFRSVKALSTTSSGCIYITSSNGLLYLINTRFDDIESRYRGGAIFVSSSSDGSYLENCSFHQCKSFDLGGTIFLASGTFLNLIKCNFDECMAKNDDVFKSGNWGGVLYGLESTMKISGCNFSNCQSSSGGVIYGNKMKTIEFFEDNSIFKNNYAVVSGGSLYIILGSASNIFQGIEYLITEGFHIAENGGFLYLSGSSSYPTIEFQNCHISNCYAYTSGGFLYNSNQQISIHNFKITNCSASVNGGFIYNTIGVEMINCEFIDCSKTICISSSAAAYSLIITSTTFISNEDYGIYFNGNILTMNYCTFDSRYISSNSSIIENIKATTINVYHSMFSNTQQNIICSIAATTYLFNNCSFINCQLNEDNISNTSLFSFGNQETTTNAIQINFEDILFENIEMKGQFQILDIYNCHTLYIMFGSLRPPINIQK